jgi:hypothetical protein
LILLYGSVSVMDSPDVGRTPALSAENAGAIPMSALASTTT